jgi:aryl-alcohol dehydrogenase-like predicted oxidoreductase
VCEGIRSGIRVLDTAPNYRGGQAFDHIRDGVNCAVNAGAIDTPQDVLICSKSGFMRNQHEVDNLVRQGRLRAEECIHRHAISPMLLAHHIHCANSTIGRPLDFLFLHNPEVQATRVGTDGMYPLLAKAFETLESACESGAIRGYGVSSWSGFADGIHSGIFSIRDLWRIARDVGGDSHRFRAVQFPISLIRIEPIAGLLQRGQGPLQEAGELGLCVFASSPLHGGRLPRLLEQAFVNSIAPGLTPAQACLLLIKSIPHVDVVLTSPSSVLQVIDNIEVNRMALLPVAHVRHVVDLVS